MVSTSALLASSQDVTLPPLPELFDANFLDTLLPITEKTAFASPSTPERQPQNALLEALKGTSHQTYTTNAAKAFNSTDSPVLDAFHHLTPYASTYDIYDSLSKAWAEDPQLTLRIIWNARSIHDGKGEKELFYRFAFDSSDASSKRSLIFTSYQGFRVALQESSSDCHRQPARTRLLRLYPPSEERRHVSWVLEGSSQSIGPCSARRTPP